VTITNNGPPGKGVIAEGLTINLTIPADTTVVAATGAGYQGIHTGHDQGHSRNEEGCGQCTKGPGEVQHYALQGSIRCWQSQGRYPLHQTGAKKRSKQRGGQYRVSATLITRSGRAQRVVPLPMTSHHYFMRRR
jgi:hypothetical protein